MSTSTRTEELAHTKAMSYKMGVGVDAAFQRLVYLDLDISLTRFPSLGPAYTGTPIPGPCRAVYAALLDNSG